MKNIHSVKNTVTISEMYVSPLVFTVENKYTLTNEISEVSKIFIRIIIDKNPKIFSPLITALSYEKSKGGANVFDMLDILSLGVSKLLTENLLSSFEEGSSLSLPTRAPIQISAKNIFKIVYKEYEIYREALGLPNIDLPNDVVIAHRVVEIQEPSSESEPVPVMSQERTEPLTQPSIPEIGFGEDKSSPSSKLKEIQQLVGDLECEEKDVLNKAMLKLAGFLLKEEGKTDILMQISSMKDVDFTTSILETLFKCKEFEFARKTTLKEALGLDNIPTYNNMVVNNLLEREFKNMSVDASNMHLDEIMEKHPEVFERVSEELNATFGQRVRKEDLTTLIKSGREVSIKEMLGFVTGPDSVVGSQLRGNKPTDVTATVTTQQVNGIAAAVKDAFPSGKKPKYSHSVKPNINKTVKN